MANVGWDQSRFNRTFKRYMTLTSKTLTEAINTKAFYIAKGALEETDAATPARIKGDLGEIIRVQKVAKKSGRKYNSRTLSLTKSRSSDAPLAALIINKRRGKLESGGKGGLHGAAMKRAIIELINNRMKSLAFLRSGWIPVLRTLRGMITGSSNMPVGATQWGKDHGEAIPARNVNGAQMVATIINTATAEWDKRDDFTKIGGKGLQASFDRETASMKDYIRDKMIPGANEFNADNR